MQPNCYAEVQMSVAVHLTLLGDVLRKRSDYIKPGLSVCDDKSIAMWLLKETNKNLEETPTNQTRKPKPTQNKLPRRWRSKLRKTEPHSNVSARWSNSVKTNKDNSRNTLPARLGYLAAKHWCYLTSVMHDMITCSSSDHLISLPLSKVAFVNHTLSSCPQLKKNLRF